MDQIGTALQQLIEMVKSLAPAVWEIYMRQVFVSAVSNTAEALFFLGLGIWMISINHRLHQLPAKRGKKVSEYGGSYDVDDVNADRKTWSAIGAIVFLAVFVMFSSFAFAKFYNPGYYAIELLISTATGK